MKTESKLNWSTKDSEVKKKNEGQCRSGMWDLGSTTQPHLGCRYFCGKKNHI